MRRRTFAAVLAGLPLVAIALGAPAGGAAAAEYEWKWQSYWQAGTVNQRAFEQFAENVKEKSGGRIEIETLPVDAVVPQSEILDAISVNILQGSNGGIGYYVGKDPAFALLADWNAGYENPEQMTAWFYEGGGNELARELYEPYGAYFLGPAMWGAESIPSKMPLRNVHDFEGIKMRAPEGIPARRSCQARASASRPCPARRSTPRSNAARSRRPTGARFGMNDELGYDRIAPYAIYPGIHSMPAIDFAINLAIWNSSARAEGSRSCRRPRVGATRTASG